MSNYREIPQGRFAITRTHTCCKEDKKPHRSRDGVFDTPTSHNSSNTNVLSSLVQPAVQISDFVPRVSLALITQRFDLTISSLNAHLLRSRDLDLESGQLGLGLVNATPESQAVEEESLTHTLDFATLGLEQSFHLGELLHLELKFL